MILTITPAGYGLIQQALNGGPSVIVDQFKVGSRSRYTMLSTRFWPLGSFLYESRVTDSFALSLDQMCWICDIDSWQPEWAVGELALYAQTVKFAQGNIGSPVPRRQGEALRLFPQVYARGLAKVCSQQYSADSPLDRFGTVDQLLVPDQVKRTSVCVLRGKKASETTSLRSPIIVVKTSGQDLSARWLPVNCNLAYSGAVEQPTANQVRIPSENNLNLFRRDVVMVQVLSGPDKGLCRSVSNISSSGLLTLSLNTTVPECEIWTSPGFYSDAECEDRLPFDDDENTQLPDPDPLCEGTVVVVVPPPPPPPPPPWVQPPPPPPPWVQPPIQKRMAVHFSSRPLAFPFEVNENTKQLGYAGIAQRIRQVSSDPVMADFTIGRWFDEDARVGADRRIQWAYAMIPDTANVRNIYHMPINGYIEPAFRDQGNKIYSGDSGELVTLGEYPDLLAAIPRSTTPSVMNIYNGLNAILIPEHYRLIVFEFPQFQGRIIADLFGPLYLMSRQGYNTVRYDQPLHVPVYRRNLTSIQPVTLPAGLQLPTQTLPPVTVTEGTYIEPGSIEEPPATNYLTDPPIRQFDWSLHDVAWRGILGQMIPKPVRLESDSRMLQLFGSQLRDQPTPYLLEPDLWRWKGSFKLVEI